MNNYPLIKTSVLFATGIVLQKFIHPVFYVLILLILLSAASALIFLTRRRGAVINKWAPVPVFFSVVLLGQLDMSAAHSNYNPLPRNLFYQKVISAGTVVDIHLIGSKSLDFLISTDSIVTGTTHIITKTKLLCRLYKSKSKDLNDIYDKLSVGNILEISGKLTQGRKAGNPGEFDYFAYLKNKGIGGIIKINKASDIKFLDNRRNISDVLFKTRKMLDKKISMLCSPQSSALYRGLLLADRSLIKYDLRTNFINSGLVHLLAVSGLHVGYIILIVIVLTGRFNLYIRSIITVIVLAMFALITGMPPSVVRASIMASIFVFAFLTGRTTNLINSLAAAAILILIINPEELFNPGFQLSFSAVLSIAVFYPALSARILSAKISKEYLKKLLLFLSVSFSAQIGTLPLTLFYFGKTSLVGLISNLIAIPVMGVIVGLGIVTLASGYLCPFAAVYFGACSDMLIFLFNSFVSITGSLKFSYLSAADFSFIDVVIFYSFLFFLFRTLKSFTHIPAKIFLVCLSAACVILFCSTDDVELLKKNKLNIVMIDVGQGDSFLIKFPDGRTVLVDAGIVTPYTDNGTNVIAPLLKRLDVRRIDYGFVSHIDADHYAGFVPLIHEGLVKKIYKPAIDSANKRDVRFEKFALNNNIQLEYYRKEILKEGNARIYILNNVFVNSRLKKTTNSSSGLLKIVYGKSSVLFTGDLSQSAERLYADMYGQFLRSDILKVSHHGSKTGTSDELLKTCAPKICLISVGAGNKFGHPSKETLDKITNFGSKIFRTDLSGAVILISDGDTFKFCDWK